ncbi:hypothetical protein CAAN1_04S01706 [[Candida] anglica]|uniref:Extradiol ring-cleavage dioxygenase class III enzyme subunit B domain-containing protein n=1 Tax=[Candida] anglica TaxID=148631 RepID=A0ABP0ECH4_9ASCO
MKTSEVAATASDNHEEIGQTITNENPYPALFISHGGPNFIYKDEETQRPWNQVRKLGQTIKNNWKPDYIVVVSAHWQSSGSNLIEISVPPPPKPISSVDKSISPVDSTVENPLIYDFYGFPNHMYREQFHSKGSSLIAEQLQAKLKEHGFHAHVTPRGIDHGVWVPFKVAFSDYNTQSGVQPKEPTWDLPNTPVIQVSLTSNDRDFDSHYRLGEVLDHFRRNLIWDQSENRHLKGLVIGSGMSVHNLRDLRYVFEGRNAPYVKPFSDLLSTALTSGNTKENKKRVLDNLKEIQANHRDLLYRAHPTLEHFLPVVVVSASAGLSPVKELFMDYQGSLAWGMYQFGEDYQK